jgi:D-inositol-3-phosphate glycosyltransferase
VALDGWRATFDRAQARRRQDIPEDEFILLCVGTIDPHKSQILVIQAFAWVAERHPEATLRLVGGYGSKYEEAAHLAAAEYGLQQRVRIQPLVADVRPWYGIADLVVSASDRESVPRSILEAMALGVPVLCTSVFGVPGLISDGETGWLCEPRDVQALACAIDRVLNLQAPERQRVAHNAHRMVEIATAPTSALTRRAICCEHGPGPITLVKSPGNPTFPPPKVSQSSPAPPDSPATRVTPLPRRASR